MCFAETVFARNHKIRKCVFSNTSINVIPATPYPPGCWSPPFQVGGGSQVHLGNSIPLTVGVAPLIVLDKGTLGFLGKPWFLGKVTKSAKDMFNKSRDIIYPEDKQKLWDAACTRQVCKSRQKRK